MACKVDSEGAGQYQDALEAAAKRFCADHSNEEWVISGVRSQSGMSLNASCEGYKPLVQLELVPMPNPVMEEYILSKLEKFRSERQNA